MQGYLYIDDILEGQEACSLEIDFQVPPRFVRANPRVREDAGKVALMKGPIVYCLEETDNGENLPALFIDTKKPLSEQFEEELLGGVTTVTLSGKRLKETGWGDGLLYDEQAPEFEDVEVKAVPYYCWGNRRPGEMLVWMKEIL